MSYTKYQRINNYKVFQYKDNALTFLSMLREYAQEGEIAKFSILMDFVSQPVLVLKNHGIVNPGDHIQMSDSGYLNYIDESSLRWMNKVE